MLGLFLSVGAYAQNITVKGHVKDALGGVIGANVVEKGNSTNGTITDLDGNFTLTVPQGATLVVSFIGYKTQEVAAAPSVIITLQDDAELLGEVVVIGYGTAKKNDLTGSVTAISADKMVKGAVTSATDMLVGKAAGVSVITDGGAPGAGATIRVRGGSSMSASNNPLIVIDGVPVDDGGINGMSNPLATVHPNDIETFTILKDASATAIYGSRASNGVILITTKRGKEGKVTTTYSGYVTIQRPTNMPEPVAAWEYLQAELNSWDNAGITVTETQREQQLKLIEEQRTLKPDNWNRYDTNWKEETLKDNAIMHSHNVTISGGTDKLSFFASGSYMGQEGLIPNDEYNRTNIRLNADAKLTSWMKVGIETNLRQSELTNPGMGSPKSIINQALYMLPTLSAARELDGNWGYGKNGLNPTAMANASGEKKTRSTEALVNGTITLTTIKGLELKGQYSRRPDSIQQS